MKTLIRKIYTHPYVHCSIIYNSQDMEATQVPINRWMGKEDVNCDTQWNISHKKEWNLAIHDYMDGPRGYYTTWNKSDRERQIVSDFTYMWNLKKQNK